MDEAKPSALELRREPHVAKDAAAIRLPAETPPAPEPPIDLESQPTAEQISKNELRLMAEAKNPPVPDKLLETLPLDKPSHVVPVQVSATMLQDFLDALAQVALESDIPILRNVRMTYTEGELLLEATDQRVWALVKLKVTGGRDGFECVLPLARARNVIRRMQSRYSNLSIGLDMANIHIGNYSIPHGGAIREFPARPALMPEQLKVALPAYYVSSILKRLGPAASADSLRPAIRGIHLDFNQGLAVATDGHRLHMLSLADVKMATRTPNRAQPSVTLTLEFFRFLQSVVEREWVGLVINEKLVTAAGDDFGVLARPVEESFPPWQRIVPQRAGYWVVDKEALRQAARDALTLGSEQVTLAVDTIGERIIVKARGKDASYETMLPARRRGGPPAVRLTVHPRYLLDAVEATGGGLVRLGFDEDGGELEPLTVRGEEEDFLAVIMPIRT